MPKNSLNVSLKGADDIFSTEESRQEQQREQVQQIPIGELFPFKNHPFKVLDDESMQRTVESVEQYGVLSPLIARPRPEGGYEIISGHRRQHAAQLATTMRPFSPYSANFSSESYQEENHSNTNEPRDDFLLMEFPESKRSYKQNTQ